jgi:hypothetical protein
MLQTSRETAVRYRESCAPNVITSQRSSISVHLIRDASGQALTGPQDASSAPSCPGLRSLPSLRLCCISNPDRRENRATMHRCAHSTILHCAHCRSPPPALTRLLRSPRVAMQMAAGGTEMPEADRKTRGDTAPDDGEPSNHKSHGGTDIERWNPEAECCGRECRPLRARCRC